MNKLKLFALVLLTFLLTACDSSLQKAERTVGLMQDSVSVIVGELDTIQNLENVLQENFESMIDQDQSLLIFQSSDNEIQENIHQRDQHLEKLNQSTQDLADLAPELVELKRNQSLPADEFQEVSDLINEIDQHLRVYIDDYQENLQKESLAFQSLANPETDYNNFFQVIDTVNTLSVNNLMNLNQVLTYFEPLNIHLVNLKVSLINSQEK